MTIQLTPAIVQGLELLGECRLEDSQLRVECCAASRTISADDLRAISFACREMAELLEGDKVADPESPLTNNHKAFLLSIALGCVFDVKKQEKGETQASVKRRKVLRAVEGLLVKGADLYLPATGFDAADMDRAVEVIELVNQKVREFYP